MNLLQNPPKVSSKLLQGFLKAKENDCGLEATDRNLGLKDDFKKKIYILYSVHMCLLVR